MNFELRVTNDTDEDGYYIASVYELKGDESRILKAIADVSRDAAMYRAKEWAAWYRDHDHSHEVIAL